MNAVATPPGGFSRRSFFLFLLLAPAGILMILSIVLATQYRHFRAMVSPAPEVAAFSWTDANRAQSGALVAALLAFSVPGASRPGRDSLWLTAEDLGLLMAASPVAASQNLRFRVEIRDSLLIVRSTQPVEAMSGLFTGILKRLAHHSGYLNARIEGTLGFRNGRVEFEPVRGFLNGEKVPSAALSKRGGLAPADFVEDKEAYERFVAKLGGVKATGGRILLVGK